MQSVETETRRGKRRGGKRKQEGSTNTGRRRKDRGRDLKKEEEDRCAVLRTYMGGGGENPSSPLLSSCAAETLSSFMGTAAASGQQDSTDATVAKRCLSGGKGRKERSPFSRFPISRYAREGGGASLVSPRLQLSAVHVCECAVPPPCLRFPSPHPFFPRPVIFGRKGRVRGKVSKATQVYVYSPPVQFACDRGGGADGH